MIDKHRVAVEEIVAHVDDDAVRGSEHGSTQWRGYVHAAVRIARFTVEDAPQPEGAGSPARHRRAQPQRCRYLRRESGEGRLDVLALAGHALQIGC